MDGGHLLFRDATQPGHATRYIEVVSRADGAVVGFIQWHSPWRQYCFLALGGTLWNPARMAEVDAKLRKLMAEYRARKRPK